MANNFQVFDAYGSVITIESSVFGTEHRQIVGASIIGAINTNVPAGSVAAVRTDNASVIAVVQSSVATVPIGTIITSVVSTVPSSVIVGASVFGQLPAGTALLGSVVALSVPQGTVITSIVSTVPSSVIVGASIFGQLPAGTATIGAVTAPSGSILSVTNPAGSITSITHPAGSVTGIRTDNASVITMFQNSSIISLPAPIASLVLGTADLRTQQGGSVVALASPGTGIRNYVTNVQVSNFGPSSVLVTIADNTTSTLGWTIAPAGGGSNFNPLYRAAANSPVTASINGTASVLVSMQGFTL